MPNFYHIHRSIVPSKIEQNFIDNRPLFFSLNNSVWYKIELDICQTDEEYDGCTIYKIIIPQKIFVNSIEKFNTPKILKISNDNISDYKNFIEKNNNIIKSLSDHNIIGVDLTDEKIWSKLSKKPSFLFNSNEGCLWKKIPEIEIKVYKRIVKSRSKKTARKIKLFAKQKISKNNKTKKNIMDSDLILTQQKIHSNAKKYLGHQLSSIGAFSTIINPVNILKSKKNNESKISSSLDNNIFSYSLSFGVQDDIQNDATDNNNVYLYGVASQFNGCEAADRFTPKSNKAWDLYKTDFTQGPGAQLQFGKKQVEIINEGANLGFNGLINLLTEETYSSVKHGYFTPENQKQADLLLRELKVTENLNKIEYQLIGNTPIKATGKYGPGKNAIPKNTDKEKHNNKLFILLTAAPALGGYIINPDISIGTTDQICYYIALANYRALFNAALKIREKFEPKKSIIIKPTGVGLGVFGNPWEQVAKAYIQVCGEYQIKFQEKNIKVYFQVFHLDKKNNGPAYQLVQKVEQFKTQKNQL